MNGLSGSGGASKKVISGTLGVHISAYWGRSWTTIKNVKKGAVINITNEPSGNGLSPLIVNGTAHSYPYTNTEDNATVTFQMRYVGGSDSEFSFNYEIVGA
jgi:hypothetical protein